MGGALSVPTDVEVAKVVCWLEEHRHQCITKMPPLLKAQLVAAGSQATLELGQPLRAEYASDVQHPALIDEHSLPHRGDAGVYP
jgi:hypothetical protein